MASAILRVRASAYVGPTGEQSTNFYAGAHALRVSTCNPETDVPLRCLIVDDQPRFCEAAGDLLEGQGVAVVGCATSSAEAVRSVRELRPDVALVDVHLGAESGFDLARLLAADRDGNNPKVILISTRDENELMGLIESSPAIGFLSKTDLSAERIYRLLDRRDD
jgi:DNA-binding NarL/FixJ family response regulator